MYTVAKLVYINGMGYMLSKEQAFTRNSERYHRRLRAAGHDYDAVDRAQEIAHLERFAEKFGDLPGAAEAISEIPQKIAAIRAAGPVVCFCEVCQEEAAARLAEQPAPTQH